MEKVEIECRCKDCIYFEKGRFVAGACYCWGDEPGESSYEVEEDDFCSNGVSNDNP